MSLIKFDTYALDGIIDERIERQQDIKDYYGTALFDDDGRLIPLHAYEYFIEPTCHLAVMMSQQEQITQLQEIVRNQDKNIQQLKIKTGWTSGYDDNDWPIEESLAMRITKLEKEVEKL